MERDRKPPDASARRQWAVLSELVFPWAIPALIVIAAYYVLFATMGGAQALPAELIAAIVFVVIAILGFRTSLWWVAAGIAGHGMFDWLVRNALTIIVSGAIGALLITRVAG